MEWWVRKKAKEMECELHKIKLEDIRLLELIRGVRDSKLKEEFLKQKEPTLNQLLEIAGRWHTAAHVGKEMDGDSVIAKKTSNYKAEKSDKWAKDAEERGRKTQTKGDACQYCRWTPKHNRSKCPAIGQPCSKCRNLGLFRTVCRNSKQDRSKSKGRDSGRPQS